MNNVIDAVKVQMLFECLKQSDGKLAEFTFLFYEMWQTDKCLLLSDFPQSKEAFFKLFVQRYSVYFLMWQRKASNPGETGTWAKKVSDEFSVNYLKAELTSGCSSTDSFSFLFNTNHSINKPSSIWKTKTTEQWQSHDFLWSHLPPKMGVKNAFCRFFLG